MPRFKSRPMPLFVYFTLWCLYSLQGVLYTSGSLISRGLLLIILFWSIGIMFKVNTTAAKLPNFFYAVNCFLIVATIYGVILIISGEVLFVHEYDRVSSFEYLKNIYISLLPMYVFYFYTLTGEMKMKHLLVFIIVLLGINVINYVYGHSLAMMRAIQNRTTTEGFTLNVGYKFIALLPLILVYNKRPLLQYILTLISLFFVILCMKRGAIIIGIVCFIIFLSTMLKFSRRNNRFIIIILSLASLIIGVYYIVDLLGTNDYFVYRLNQTLEGDSSGRDKLYLKYLNHFISERNFFRFFFGNGANATLKVGANYAHNDWLELAINNGIVGLVLYLWYFVALFKDYKFIRKYNKYYANVILMVLIVLFMSSLISMSYNSIEMPVSIALGFIFAISSPYNNENNLLYR